MPESEPATLGYFMNDYFTSYRLNSFGWFGGNIRGAVEKVEGLNASTPVKAIYLSPKIPYGIERWQFYLAKDGREDLFARTRVLDLDVPLATMPPGSLFVVNVVDREPQDPRARSGELWGTARFYGWPVAPTTPGSTSADRV